jgi:hypothetical protein
MPALEWEQLKCHIGMVEIGYDTLSTDIVPVQTRCKVTIQFQRLQRFSRFFYLKNAKKLIYPHFLHFCIS